MMHRIRTGEVIIACLSLLVFFIITIKILGIGIPFIKNDMVDYDALEYLKNCEREHRELLETTIELDNIKNIDHVRENTYLKKEVNKYQSGRFMLAILWICTILIIGMIQYFFINKYQVNKIKELEDKLIVADQKKKKR